MSSIARGCSSSEIAWELSRVRAAAVAGSSDTIRCLDRLAADASASSAFPAPPLVSWWVMCSTSSAIAILKQLFRLSNCAFYKGGSPLGLFPKGDT